MVDAKKPVKQTRKTNDPRFAGLAKDPRFQKFPQSQKRVQIDSRFAGMFSDPAFQDAARVDKRGKKVKANKSKEDMQRYYKLPDAQAELRDEAGDAPAAPAPSHVVGAVSGAVVTADSIAEAKLQATSIPLPQVKKVTSPAAAAKEAQRNRGVKLAAAAEELRNAELTDEVEDESQDESEDEEAEAQRRWARMRGLDADASSSSEEDEDIEGLAVEDADGADEEWGVGAMAANPSEAVPLVEDATARLACVDMDWDHVRAVDILAILQSFLRKGSTIRQVTVHVSDYGKERLAEEARSGPQGVFLNGKQNGSIASMKANGKPTAQLANLSDEPESPHGDHDVNDRDDGSSSSGDEVDRERIARYEKSKLRYYFAIVECSDAVAADALYRECDGMEFEHSSNAMDLRFVPDDKEFAAFEIRDTAAHVPGDYIPPGFSTAALQHTNVKLTWDDDDDQRKKMLRRRVSEGELQEEDLRVFLGSDDEEEEGRADEAEAPAAFPASDPANVRITDRSGNAGSAAAEADKYRQLLLGGSDKLPGRKGGKDWGAAAAADGTDSDEDELSDEERPKGGGMGEMEVTFVPGLDKLGQRLAAQKQAAGKKGSETVWDAYLRKKREKRLKAKASGKHVGSSDDDSDESDGEARPADAAAERDPFFQQDADPFNDPFFQDGGDASAGTVSEEGQGLNKNAESCVENHGYSKDSGNASADRDSEGEQGPGMSTKGRAGKQGRRQKGTGAAGPEAAAEAAVHSASQGYREQLGVKGQKPSKEERKLAAEAERQRRAELELLLMDDTALRDASVAGGVQQPVTNGTAGTKPKLSRKDRIRAKKEAKKLARQADSDDDDLAISGRGRPGSEAQDSRFQRLFTSPDFALDPTNPLFKQTQASQAVAEMAASRRGQAKHAQEQAPAKPLPPAEQPSDGNARGESASSVKGMVAALKRKAKAQAEPMPSSSPAKRVKASKKQQLQQR